MGCVVGDGNSIRHLLSARGNGHTIDVGCGICRTEIRLHDVGDVAFAYAENPQSEVPVIEKVNVVFPT